MSKSKEHGTLFEMLFQALLTILGYEYIPDGAWTFDHRKDKTLLPSKYYSREVVVGESAKKGQMRRVEFFIVNHMVFPDGLIIECKWQDWIGSLEDKLFRLPQDIQKTGIPTLAIVDGLGFSQSILEYLKENVDGRLFLASWSFVELITQVNKGYFGDGIIKPIIPRKKIKQPQQKAFDWEVTDDRKRA